MVRSMSAINPETKPMKAVVIRQFGGPEVLEIADLPVPGAWPRPGTRQGAGCGGKPR